MFPWFSFFTKLWGRHIVCCKRFISFTTTTTSSNNDFFAILSQIGKYFISLCIINCCSCWYFYNYIFSIFSIALSSNKKTDSAILSVIMDLIR